MENQTTSSERPIFLTIVCILSFIGLGWNILNNLFTLAFSSTGSWLYDLLQVKLEEALNEAGRSDPDVAVFLENIFDAVLKIIERLPFLATVSLICAIVALIGVILMWGLKRTGFYLYTGAKIVLVIMPLAIVGFNFISMMMAMGTAIGAAIFIVLYGLNFKHLT